MATLCVLGGVLNLAGGVSRPVVWLVLGVGLAAAWRFARSRVSVEEARAVLTTARRDLPGTGLFVIVFGLVLVQVLASAARPLNGHDDHQGYLVFAVRLLDTGSIGDDPFNERRMGAWGGQSFLQTLMLPMVDHENLGALDGGVGWLVFVSLVLSHGRRRRLDARACAALLLCLHAYWPPAVNLSSLVTGLALFYGLSYFLTESDTGRRGIIPIVLLVAALVSLKHSMVPGVVLISAALVLGDSSRPVARRWMRLVGIALFAGLISVPWMISMHQSSGTALYPLLGRGVHGFGSPWTMAPPINLPWSGVTAGFMALVIEKIARLPSILPGLLLLVSAANGVSRELGAARRVFLAALTATILLTVSAMGLARYSYPFALAAFVCLAVETLASHDRWKERGARSASSPDLRTLIPVEWRPWIVLAAFAILSWTPDGPTIGKGLRDIGAFRPAGVTSRAVDGIHAAQGAVAGGAAVLAVLSRPVALDFTRNEIFVVDHAGSASPPPGFPLAKDAMAIADYLAEVGVRYVMYSYGDEAIYGRSDVGSRLDLTGTPYRDRLRMLAANNVRFRDAIMELAKEHRPVFDDGFVLVIDLESVTARPSRLVSWLSLPCGGGSFPCKTPSRSPVLRRR